jgi:hypothetical protein
MRILVMGDFHIPSRAKSIPVEIFEFISKAKSDLILCTGDLTDGRILDKLGRIAPLKWVMGNTDYIRRNDSERLRLEEYDIGLVHGTEIYPRGDKSQLYDLAKKMNVNILISGHTHAMSIQHMSDCLLVNPGSATGAWGGGPATLKPSFMILEIYGEKIAINCYELTNNELTEFSKRFIKEGGTIVESI